MIGAYIHRVRRTVEKYEKWLVEDPGNAKKRLLEVLDGYDDKTNHMTRDLIRSRNLESIDD